MPLYLPFTLFAIQLIVMGVFGHAVTAPLAYIVMVVAPLLAAVATVRRGRSHSGAVRSGWYALSLTLTIWSIGAFDNLWQELIRHHQNEMYRVSMLAFNLAVVPTTYLLATDWQLHGRQLLRAVDALAALALGSAYFLYTWHMINDHSTSAEAGVAYLVWLLDLQNLSIVAGAMVRWYVSQDRDERDLFRSLAVYELIYSVIVFINDHYFAGNPAYGPEYGSVISFAFALLATSALRSSSSQPVRAVSPELVRVVRSSSPILLAIALLTASLFLVHVEYLWGCAGIVIAVLGIAVRTTLMQVHQMQHGEALRREASALQTIAWTDALTGVPNRHFFTEALTRTCRQDHRADKSADQAILMLDIDHFKQLNDRYGHLVGDGCLREVARALQQTLVHPEDVLARYGGEEFIVLLRDSQEACAHRLAERLRAAVQALQIENAGSPERVVTVSIGVASAALTSELAAARMVEDADRALYEAKCAGRNQVKLASECARNDDTLLAVTARRRRLRV